jgi:hypothetical protein
MDLFGLENNGAEFSKDRKYRYALWRVWDEKLPMVAYIGINPSKANESVNDNTITKVKKISAYNGFGGLYMMNLFAYITTRPEVLLTCGDPLGDNNGWLEKIAPKCEKIVFAWGNFKQAQERSKEVMKMFPEAYCLHQNLNGTPKHPLYCLDETKLIPFDIALLK